jgi:zinc protease
LLATQKTPSGAMLYHYQLSNGQNVFIEPRPGVRVASLRTFIQSGSAYENSVKPSPLYRDTGFPSGIAHLDEHCRFLTHKHYPEKNQWAGLLDTYADSNAATSGEWVGHLMAFNASDLPKAIAMHGEALLNPVYRPQDLAQEQTTVINEIRMRGNLLPRKVADKTYTLMFDRPLQQTGGTPEDVRRTTVEHLQRFRNEMYIPSRMVTVVAGGVDPAITAQMLEQALGSNPAVPDTLGLRGMRYALPPGEIRRVTVTEPEINYSVLQLGFKGPTGDDVKSRLIMGMLAQYLSNPVSGLLNQRLVHQKHLATDVAVDHDAQLFTGLTTVDVDIPAGKESPALNETLAVLQQVADQGIPPETLEKIRNTLRYDFQRSIQKAHTITDLIGHEATHGNLQYYLQFEPTLNSITAEDVLKTARRFLTLDSYTQVLFVPAMSAAGAPQGEQSPPTHPIEPSPPPEPYPLTNQWVASSTVDSNAVLPVVANQFYAPQTAMAGQPGGGSPALNALAEGPAVGLSASLSASVPLQSTQPGLPDGHTRQYWG